MYKPFPIQFSTGLIALALLAITPFGLALDQATDLTQPASNPEPAKAPPSLSVTVNLIKQLVESGVLSKDKADGLLKQAETEAAEARAQMIGERNAAIQAAVAQTLAQTGIAAVEPLPKPEESSRITYVPEVVRDQIRDEVKREVESDVLAGNVAAAPKLPGWVERFGLFADIRVRAEGINFGSGNDDTGAFPNFNAINTGKPFDTTGSSYPPELNVDQDRQRLRLRARLGVESQLGEGFTAGLRIATGNTNSPTSTNQDLGAAANAQGGGFSKYAIWLDRAFLRYDLGHSPDRNLSLMAGRFDNPFFSTEVIWDDDLGFDGAALQGRYKLGDRFTPFIAGGAFPVFNTDLNFASNQPAKFASYDKWLYGIQGGSDIKLADKISLKTAAAYYYFQNIEGRLSDPFVPLSPDDAGNTDSSRPSFAQKGNTYRPLRNIIPTAENDYGTSKQYQYYGLATPFRNLALTARLDFNYWEPCQVSFLAEYTKNLAFDLNSINAVAINNRGATSTNSTASFSGGDTAWIVGVRLGKPAFAKFGDWGVGINYRHVETDAVVDGFCDSDFGMGGTNLKGFSLWAAVALSQRVNAAVRWTSSDEVSGPTFAVDIFQVELNARF